MFPFLTTFIYKSFANVAGLFLLVLLHLLRIVCLTAWLALFCSFQLQSDYEDRSNEFRMFLIGKCFQVFEMKSCKCYHFPCLFAAVFYIG